MSLQADSFDPDVVRGTLKNLYKTATEKSKFEGDWKADVAKRVTSWRSHKDNKKSPTFQLEWESEVVQYVDYIYQKKLSTHGNASALTKQHQ